MTEADDPWNREALRIYRRYQIEFVEAFSLCPWAKKARTDGRVREKVIRGETVDELGLLNRLSGLERDREVEIGLFIFPNLTLGHLAFDAAVESFRKAAQQHRLTEFAAAAFHPAGFPNRLLESASEQLVPARLVPLWRRSPDPTIQLVRLSALARVRKGESGGTGFVDPEALFKEGGAMSFSGPLPTEGPSLHERVHEANSEMLNIRGSEALLRVLDDIYRDRDATYSKLPLAPER